MFNITAKRNNKELIHVTSICQCLLAAWTKTFKVNERYREPNVINCFLRLAETIKNMLLRCKQLTFTGFFPICSKY